MSSNNSSQVNRYSNLAIIFHWIMVFLILTLFILGWYMVDLPKGSDERTWFFALHKSIGLTTALFAILRLVWRVTHQPPQLPLTVPQMQQLVASITHFLLYAFMFIQPVSGYISSSFSGYKTRFWGIPLPHWGWKSPDLNELFTEIHEISSIILLTLICLHIGGALYHALIKRDGIIKRMMPRIGG